MFIVLLALSIPVGGIGVALMVGGSGDVAIALFGLVIAFLGTYGVIYSLDALNLLFSLSIDDGDRPTTIPSKGDTPMTHTVRIHLAGGTSRYVDFITDDPDGFMQQVVAEPWTSIRGPDGQRIVFFRDHVTQMSCPPAD